jgi:aconitate hydratase
MMRGTFGNIRLKNAILSGVEGPSTVHVPTGETLSIYDAALRYREEGTPLIVLAGKEYGAGSSRDWAAKGSALLGIKAVIAESYERIHRSNLLCMGVLPLQFAPGDSVQSLGLTGFERFTISGIGTGITPRQNAHVSAVRQDHIRVEFDAIVRIDAAAEVEYFRNGGLLPMVLRELLELPSTGDIGESDLKRQN